MRIKTISLEDISESLDLEVCVRKDSILWQGINHLWNLYPINRRDYLKIELDFINESYLSLGMNWEEQNDFVEYSFLVLPDQQPVVMEQYFEPGEPPDEYDDITTALTFSVTTYVTQLYNTTEAIDLSSNQHNINKLPVLLRWQLAVNGMLRDKFPDVEIWAISDKTIKFLFAGGESDVDLTPVIKRKLSL